MYGSVTNTHVKETPCMFLILSSILKSTGKCCLMKPCMVTLSLPISKSKGKYRMAEEPSLVWRVSLSHIVEIGLKSPHLFLFLWVWYPMEQLLNSNNFKNSDQNSKKFYCMNQGFIWGRFMKKPEAKNLGYSTSVGFLPKKHCIKGTGSRLGGRLKLVWQ
jgi:hypothetical protein